MNELGLGAPQVLHPQHSNARVDARAFMTWQNPWTVRAWSHGFIDLLDFIAFHDSWSISGFKYFSFRAPWMKCVRAPQNFFLFKRSRFVVLGSVTELRLKAPKFLHPQHPNARVDARALMTGQNPWATRAWSHGLIYWLAFIAFHVFVINFKIWIFFL